VLCARRSAAARHEFVESDGKLGIFDPHALERILGDPEGRALLVGDDRGGARQT
jgi:hypothetical protein